MYSKTANTFMFQSCGFGCWEVTLGFQIKHISKLPGPSRYGVHECSFSRMLRTSSAFKIIHFQRESTMQHPASRVDWLVPAVCFRIWLDWNVLCLIQCNVTLDCKKKICFKMIFFFFSLYSSLAYHI